MTYTIQLISPSNKALTIIIPLLSSLVFFLWLPSLLLAIILMLAILTISVYWLPRYTAIAQIEITKRDNGFNIQWVKQFFLHNKSDVLLYWQDVHEFKYEQNDIFTLLRFKLKNGRKIVLRHDNENQKKDDFQIFCEWLQEKINEINQTSGQENQIKRAKAVYETTLGYAFAIIMTIFLISFPIICLVFPPKISDNGNPIGALAMIAMGYISSIGFIIRVFKYRYLKEHDSYS